MSEVGIASNRSYVSLPFCIEIQRRGLGQPHSWTIINGSTSLFSDISEYTLNQQ